MAATSFVQLAHQLADELHLAAFALEVGDAFGFLQRFLQLFGQLQAGVPVGAQRQQRIAQRLQRIAFALEVGLLASRVPLSWALSSRSRSLPSATKRPFT